MAFVKQIENKLVVLKNNTQSDTHLIKAITPTKQGVLLGYINFPKEYFGRKVRFIAELTKEEYSL